MKCLEATDITSGDLRVKNAISSYPSTVLFKLENL